MRELTTVAHMARNIIKLLFIVNANLKILSNNNFIHFLFDSNTNNIAKMHK